MRIRATSGLRGTASGAGLTIEFVPTQGRNDDRDVRTAVEESTRPTGKRANTYPERRELTSPSRRNENTCRSQSQYHDGTESSRARPGGTRTHVAQRAYTMTERRAHEPGDGGFLYVLGGGPIRYVSYCILHVSCMYFDVSRSDTSRYICICHFGYHIET